MFSLFFFLSVSVSLSVQLHVTYIEIGLVEVCPVHLLQLCRIGQPRDLHSNGVGFKVTSNLDIDITHLGTNNIRAPITD